MEKIIPISTFLLFTLSWQVRSLVMINDTSVPATNYSISEYSNDWIPFETFNDDRFTYSGTYDPEMPPLTPTIGGDIEAVSYFLADEKPQQIRAQRGGKVTQYAGFEAETKVVVEWLMEGELWTYGQCEDAITTLAEVVRDHEILRGHFSQITISQGGHRKIRSTVTLDPGQPVVINAGTTTLRFQGWEFPNRKLLAADGRAAFTAMVQKIEAMGDASTVVQEWARNRIQNPKVGMYLYFFDLRAFEPRVTVGDVLQFLDAIQGHFIQQRLWTHLHGDIFRGKQELGTFWTFHRLFATAESNSTRQLEGIEEGIDVQEEK